MIELIRASAVPANVVRAASKGALGLPPAEMIEILVYLTTNPVFAEQAQMTLAGWDEAASIAIAADAKTPKEVLDYLTDPANRRPKLVPALLENPAVDESKLLEMAQSESRELLEAMLQSPRVMKSANVLHALGANPNLTEPEQQKLREALHAVGEATGVFAIPAELRDEPPAGEKTQYEIEHAAEIAAEEAASKPFELVGGAIEEDEAAAPIPIETAAAAPSTPAAAAAPAAAADSKTLAMRKAEAESRERLSTLQKIARLTVGERVQLAMKGSKDERFILIRDGSKVVSSAVLQSPKVSDAEIEGFAAMKNVQESVLRDIARSKKFMKNYAVTRALVSNPRCPLDLSLSLMNHLLVNDLKSLSMNKNVPDTLRKLALKRYKEKSTPPGQKRD
jgi:hypothetical protein